MLPQQFRDPQICWDAKDPSCIRNKGSMTDLPTLIGHLHVAGKMNSLIYYGSSRRGFSFLTRQLGSLVVVAKVVIFASVLSCPVTF